MWTIIPPIWISHFKEQKNAMKFSKCIFNGIPRIANFMVNEFLEANGGYAVHNISIKELKVVKAELVTKIKKLNENIVNWKPESGVSMNEYLEELENVEREHDRAELEMRRKEDSLRRGDEDNNDILRHIVLEDSDDSDEEESEDEEYENEDEGFEDGDGISDAENLLV
ncbi:hypothetical protein GCK72_023016 [Caenorhabditis remanei]|uniref:Uncharacterized protein n=1 Tax=Caenorhabditis remanei TaxID=31234 RepID=A0A6A5FVW0_CAERE|nr:hypothetical protein GCK72_023016 [Caenorhabditis remanei]KAF1746559.1 hypothetical protein GCK72_023016 [Caenorhabditis remanei]